MSPSRLFSATVGLRVLVLGRVVNGMERCHLRSPRGARGNSVVVGGVSKLLWADGRSVPRAIARWTALRDRLRVSLFLSIQARSRPNPFLLALRPCEAHQSMLLLASCEFVTRQLT